MFLYMCCLLIALKANGDVPSSTTCGDPSFYPSQGGYPAGNGTYIASRDRALFGIPDDYREPYPSDGTITWAVVVEQALPEWPQAFMFRASGRTSFFDRRGTSSPVLNVDRVRAGAIVRLADALQPSMVPGSPTCPDDTSRITIYVLTTWGVFAITASREVLSNPTHPLSSLYCAFEEALPTTGFEIGSTERPGVPPNPSLQRTRFTRR